MGQVLAGTRGLSLYVTEANGKIVTRLAQTEAQPAYSLHTTIDGPLQWRSARAEQVHRHNRGSGTIAGEYWPWLPRL